MQAENCSRNCLFLHSDSKKWPQEDCLTQARQQLWSLPKVSALLVCFFKAAELFCDCEHSTIKQNKKNWQLKIILAQWHMWKDTNKAFINSTEHVGSSACCLIVVCMQQNVPKKVPTDEETSFLSAAIWQMNKPLWQLLKHWKEHKQSWHPHCKDAIANSISCFASFRAESPKESAREGHIMVPKWSLWFKWCGAWWLHESWRFLWGCCLFHSCLPHFVKQPGENVPHVPTCACLESVKQQLLLSLHNLQQRPPLSAWVFFPQHLKGADHHHWCSSELQSQSDEWWPESAQCWPRPALTLSILSHRNAIWQFWLQREEQMLSSMTTQLFHFSCPSCRHWQETSVSWSEPIAQKPKVHSHNHEKQKKLAAPPLPNQSDTTWTNQSEASHWLVFMSGCQIFASLAHQVHVKPRGNDTRAWLKCELASCVWEVSAAFPPPPPPHPQISSWQASQQQEAMMRLDCWGHVKVHLRLHCCQHWQCVHWSLLEPQLPVWSLVLPFFFFQPSCQSTLSSLSVVLVVYVIWTTQ